MMEKSSFFNSISGDRRYKADDYAAYFASFIGNGVFPLPSTGLQVTEGEGMTVTLSAGKAWINGYLYINTDDLTIAPDTADGVLNRIDRIMIRWDLTERSIRARVKSSGFATTPTAPVPQRDADAYELCVAEIYVGKGVTKITQANITDKRLDSALCGIVTQTVTQLDTRTFALQLESWFAQYQAQASDTFSEWFTSLQEVLEGDVALNMMNLINTLTGRVEALEERPVSKGGAGSARTLYYDGSRLATVDLSVPYNEDGDRWETGAILPTARQTAWGTEFRFSHLYKGKIYVIGGMTANSIGSTKVEIYDIASDTWTTGQDAPLARFGFHSFLYDDKIIIVGGAVGTTAQVRADIYNISSNTWTLGTNMTTGRSIFGADIYEGKIYVISGSDMSAASTICSIYDIASNTWTNAAALSPARYYHCAKAVKGKIYSFGGWTPNSSTTSIYSIFGNSWTTGPNLPTPRSAGHTCTVYQDKIIVLGSSDYTDQVNIYNTLNDTWSIGAPMPTGRAAHTATLYNGEIYVIGGVTTGNAQVSSVDIYNVEANTWRTGALIPISRNNHGAHLYTNKIYVVGGGTGTYNSPSPLAGNNVRIYNADISFTEGVLMGAAQSGMSVTSADWIMLDYDGEVELAHLADKWKELDRDCRILAPKGEKAMVGLKDE